MNEQPKPSTSKAAANLENEDESSTGDKKTLVKQELKSEPDDDCKAVDVTNEPDKCPVCLQVFSSIHSKSFTSKCFHSFCFECILEWSKVRYSCPLCKTDFDRIIYDLKTRLEYKEYTLKPRQSINPALDIIPIDPNTNIEQQHQPTVESKASWVIYHQLAPLTFRMMVYTNGWYASEYQTQTYVKITNIELDQTQTTETVTSDNLICASYTPVTAHRDISPQWYQSNPASLHRLMQFIYRELKVLSAVLPSNSAERLNQKMRSQLINIITSLVKKIALGSEEFVQKMCEYIRPTKYAKHFTHELVAYARSTCNSPVDYDAKIVYYKGLDSIPRLNEKYSKNSHVVPFSSLPVCLNKYKLLTKPAVSNYVEYLEEYESYSTRSRSRSRARSRSRSNSSSSSRSSFCQELTPPRKRTPDYIVLSSSSGSSIESVHSSPTRASSTPGSTPKRLKTHHRNRYQSTSTNTSFSSDNHDDDRPKTSKSSNRPVGDETSSHRSKHSRKSKKKTKKKHKKKRKDKKHDRHRKKHGQKSKSPSSSSPSVL